jgi:chorismate mutase / prephenate dehydrogenase
VALVAKRLDLAEQIGLEKRLAGLPVRQADVEERVQVRLERESAIRGISGDFAAKLSEGLIAESVRRQEAVRIPAPLHRRVLVVGGAGRMGSWLSRFLRSRGYEVVVHDISGPLEGFPSEEDLARGVREADVIAVAVPMTVCAQLLRRIAELRPKALVFDICSLKAPIKSVLRVMGKSGLKITSIHPMFGPTLWPLASGSITFSDCGNALAVVEAKDLFRPSGAKLIDVSLDRHDEFMAYLLGTSHLALLTFARAVATSPLDLASLKRPAGTTFSRLAIAAQGLLDDPPALLRDIQALNPLTPTVDARLRQALDDWRRATDRPDDREFLALIDHARAYFRGGST